MAPLRCRLSDSSSRLASSGCSASRGRVVAALGVMVAFLATFLLVSPRRTAKSMARCRVPRILRSEAALIGFCLRLASRSSINSTSRTESSASFTVPSCSTMIAADQR